MNTIGNRTVEEHIKEMTLNHPEIWECTLDEFIAKVLPNLQECQIRNKLVPKVIKTAAGFLRIRFDRKELRGTIDYEVSRAIGDSLVYYVNCMGERV